MMTFIKRLTRYASLVDSSNITAAVSIQSTELQNRSGGLSHSRFHNPGDSGQEYAEQCPGPRVKCKQVVREWIPVAVVRHSALSHHPADKRC